MRVWECLPKYVGDILRACTDVREIRLRNNRPVKVNVGGQWYTVGKNKLLSLDSGNAPIIDESCNEIIKRACNNSVYAYEKMLAKGFFTLDDGVRVGVCGDVAETNDPVFRKYSSLCFRIPHYVSTADDKVIDCSRKGNLVVIGPPGSGKTTLLRDLAVKLSLKYAVLVADERGEILYDDKIISDCDVIKWASKSYAFEVGIRAMSPQWLVCDEISVAEAPFIRQASDSGVNLACSVHGKNLDEFVDKFGLQDVFKSAIVLCSIGKGKKIYNLNSFDYNTKLQSIK